MKDKLGLFAGYIFILIGLVKFDMFIYPTLDYFGKFVFVGALNIVPFWIGFEIYKKYSQKYAVIWGIVAGIVLYFL